jgi:hypothetical protein
LLRDFFGTHKLSYLQYTIVGAVAVGWLFLLRYVYRTHVFERFFGMDLIDDDDYDPLNRTSTRASAVAETSPTA